MQTKPEQLLRQQMILRHLGHYRGKLDGIWGPMTIEAKQRFERDRKFAPAFPNNGLPFGDRDTYPKGISYNRATRLLDCVGLSETVIAEFNALIPGSKPVEAVSAVPVEAVPVADPLETLETNVEVPTDTPSVETVVESPARESHVDNRQNKHHHQNHRRN